MHPEVSRRDPVHAEASRLWREVEAMERAEQSPRG